MFNDGLKRLMLQYEHRKDVTFCSFLRQRGMTVIAVRATSMRQESCKEAISVKEEAGQDGYDDALMDAD